MLEEREAPGPDGILNVMVVEGWRRCCCRWWVNLVVRSESCPTNWMSSLLVLLHKDENGKEVGNYGGITLGCSVVMVFMRVLVRRSGRFSEDRILMEEQGRVSES